MGVVILSFVLFLMDPTGTLMIRFRFCILEEFRGESSWVGNSEGSPGAPFTIFSWEKNQNIQVGVDDCRQGPFRSAVLSLLVVN